MSDNNKVYQKHYENIIYGVIRNALDLADLWIGDEDEILELIASAADEKRMYKIKNLIDKNRKSELDD